MLIQKKDFKSLSIAKELEELQVKLIPVDGSPMYMPWYILKCLIKYGRPLGVIYRYLNDYPSTIKTLFRFITELIGIFLALILRTPIIWICHNVDRETEMYHPRITKMRRAIISKISKKILVTDPLLISHASRYFPEYSSKIDFITFGPYSIKQGVNKSNEILDKIKKFVDKSITKKDMRVMYGFVAGRMTWKTAQYEKIPRLINEASKCQIDLKVIVIGPIGDELKKKNKELYNELKHNVNILFIDGYYYLDMPKISKYIDFYWRVYLDFSVPATIYESAYYKKPILTQEKGFLSEAVSAYGLGYIVKDDYSNLSSVLAKVSNWSPVGANNFLKNHTWKIAAEKIYKIIS